MAKKRAKKFNQYHQINCYQYHLRTTLILQGLDLKLAKMLKFDMNIMFKALRFWGKKLPYTKRNETSGSSYLYICYC